MEHINRFLLLPKDIQQSIVLDLELIDLINLCESNKQINNRRNSEIIILYILNALSFFIPLSEEIKSSKGMQFT